MKPRDETDTMPAPELEHLGVAHVVYVKRVVVKGKAHYAIHAADGTEMGSAPDRDTAFAAAHQHGLDAMSVH
jgi:hypothetical protein